MTKIRELPEYKEMQRLANEIQQLEMTIPYNSERDVLRDQKNIKLRERVLKGVKGIGLRTAQRIIVDLKDKIVSSGLAQELPATAGRATQLVSSPVKDEAMSALTMLGFSPAPTAKVVNAILLKDPTLPVEQVVKLALKQIK